MNTSAAIADPLLLGVKRHSGVELLVSSFRFLVSGSKFQVRPLNFTNPTHTT